MNTGFALGTYPLPWTIERVGRRGVMIWSAVVLTVCMLVFVIMIGLPNPTLAMQWTAVASVIVYNFVFGYGWIGVPWLYGPEVSLSPYFCDCPANRKSYRLPPLNFAT
jgi:MFS family permease